jgi:hypothetical protein
MANNFDDYDNWSCPECTFKNKWTSSQCEICDFKNTKCQLKPKVNEQKNGNHGYYEWDCPRCTYTNTSMISECAICNYAPQSKKPDDNETKGNTDIGGKSFIS